MLGGRLLLRLLRLWLSKFYIFVCLFYGVGMSWNHGRLIRWELLGIMDIDDFGVISY